MSDGGSPGPGPSLSVVPEKVREVGQYVYDVAEALRSALDSAAKDVDSLVNGSWTGDLAAEFGQGWTEVRDGGVQIITALTGMAEKLGVTADTYQARDENTATALNTSSLDLP
ncbi:ESX-1 secretion-associated protein [Nocardia pneumoniae]|uniref:ESX-1 secretion-associated protein n=1 Tax=Nocardia pneumoniae TaxID=228601 RepID=UPI0005924701|nr:ESX-1 secretion-associated protein [Nocardia pneumoniae]